MTTFTSKWFNPVYRNLISHFNTIKRASERKTEEGFWPERRKPGLPAAAPIHPAASPAPWTGPCAGRADAHLREEDGVAARRVPQDSHSASGEQVLHPLLSYNDLWGGFVKKQYNRNKKNKCGSTLAGYH